MKLDGKKVQALRMARCWSQEQLAQAAGLSVRTIQRIENGGSGSLETIKSLSAVFDIKPQNNELQHVEDSTESIGSKLARCSWAIAFLISVVLLGAWVIDILIPTLKGADFNHQYEIHNNFRYLDFAVASFSVGVAILLAKLFNLTKALKSIPFLTVK